MRTPLLVGEVVSVPSFCQALIRLRGHRPRAGVWTLADQVGKAASTPPWRKEGWPRMKKYSRSFERRGHHPRTGWFVQLPINRCLNEPPRLCPAKEASRYPINRHSLPLLCQGGETTTLTQYSHFVVILC